MQVLSTQRVARLPPTAALLAAMVCATLICAAITPTRAEAVVDVRGFVAAGGVQADAPASWRGGGPGGFGVFDTGQGQFALDDDPATEARGDFHLVLDAQSHGDRFSFGGFLHLLGRDDPGDVLGEEAGIVEAYLEARWRLRDADQFRIQLGHFILPTSRENVEWAWSSPYTLTFSSLNTWIAEEVRPTGVSLEYRHAFGDVDELRFGAAGFGGNDSAGTLLAWRGWAFSDRLTVYDEVVPLPPTASVAAGGVFASQRNDGALPFGADLDDRVGVAGWLAWSRAERAFLQVSYYDNRADRLLHPSGPGYEYAWRTRFWQTAAEWRASRLTLVSEWMWGTTGMGRPNRPHVDVDFQSYYVLASVLSNPWLGGTWRFTLRFEDFETEDVDGQPASIGDDNDSVGDALTAALFWESTARPLRVGLEWLDADVQRDQAGAQAFGSPTGQIGGQQVRLDLRYYFGR